MKKILLIMCFSILLTQVHAQKELQEKEISIDSMLINIDKSTFTSGILYDRVMGLAQVFTFNKYEQNIANVNYFEQALNDLYKASNEEKLINYKQFRKKYTDKKTSNTVDIGVINASFHRLNYDEVDEQSSGLTFDGKQFSQKDGKNPFISSHVFIASPLKKYVVGNDITFNFNEDFLIQESEKQLVSLTADFGLGKKVDLVKNKSIMMKSYTMNYEKTGYKTIIFKAVFNDGTYKITKGKLHVKILNRAFMRDPIIDGTFDSIHNATVAFQGYEPDDTTPAIKGQLEYRIFYHGTPNNYERILKKPIVIIDGFDPQDKRKISDADFDGPDDEHQSIEEMMEYTVDGSPFPTEIIPLLREEGYDVIIVNHPTYTKNGHEIDGGADYIERNGLTHASFYQFLNTTILGNGSSEELVIVGPSMGGQVSRYALAYMEEQNIDHNVKLWVSVDSPHLGANIPIGMQSMLNLLATYGDSVDADDIYNDRLKATASNQQLIEQHLPNHSPDHLNGGSIVHQTYYDNLRTNGLSNSGGYPQNLRKVALINGSLTGKKVGNFGEEDFRIHGFADHILGGNVKVMEMNTKYMPDTGGRKQVARLWRLSKPTRTATYTNNNLNGSMDVVPGGLFNTEDILHASVMGSRVRSL